MSAELVNALENARFLLGEALAPFQQGQITGVEALFGITTAYRSRGIAELLLRGVVDPLFIGQMQSASAYAHGLPTVTEDEKATAFAAPFWDAVGATYWDAAREIATHSRMTHNPKREHEDDFLYVAFLMQRYFLAPPNDAPAEEQEAHGKRQQQRLARWEQVLEGELDARLDLCRALAEQDAEAFGDAIIAVGEARREDLSIRRDKGRLRAEELAWLQPIWPEGLALLRLAERQDLSLEGLEVPGVPPVIRVDSPYVYHPDAWRTIDIRPYTRS